MKKLTNWFNNHKEGVLKSIYSLPIFCAIIISVFHCIEFFEISNPSIFAIALSLSLEIAAATTLVALLFGKMTFSIVMTFVLVTLYQMIGNIFFSFHHIDENGELFKTWVSFMSIILGEGNEWTNLTHKFWLSIMSGAIVPLLSLLSLHLISTFELKNKKVDDKIEETKPEVIEQQEVLKEDTIIPKIEDNIIKTSEIEEKKIIVEDIPKEKKTRKKGKKEDIPKPPVIGDPKIKSKKLPLSNKPAVIIDTTKNNIIPEYYEDMGKTEPQKNEEKKTRKVRIPGITKTD